LTWLQASRILDPMRLTSRQIEGIREIVQQLAGKQAELRVFGSRLDDTARGGDLDLYLELDEPVNDPAMLAARIAGQVSRLMQGRKVDVLLSAPNLKQLPIHDIARRKGKLL
jgi:predicted nucleotidyltransferase